MKVRSATYNEGHDAFLSMLQPPYKIPKCPYSVNLRSSNGSWNNGFWDAMYEWKQQLTLEDICIIAEELNDRDNDWSDK